MDACDNSDGLSACPDDYTIGQLAALYPDSESALIGTAELAVELNESCFLSPTKMHGFEGFGTWIPLGWTFQTHHEAQLFVNRLAKCTDANLFRVFKLSEVAELVHE